MSHHTQPTGPRVTTILTCGALAPALDSLMVSQRWPWVSVCALPSQLHLTPQRLQDALEEAVQSARQTSGRVLILYGECFPDIDEACRRWEVTRVGGSTCHELLLGPDRHRDLLDESAGTFFVEQDLLLHFEPYCLEPLELDDPELRQLYFEHYERIVYIRQQQDPDLSGHLSRVADLLDLTPLVLDADLRRLDRLLVEHLGPPAPTTPEAAPSQGDGRAMRRRGDQRGGR